MIPAALIFPDADKLPQRVADALGALFAVIAGASYRVEVSTFMWMVTDDVPPDGRKDVIEEIAGLAFLQLERDDRVAGPLGAAADVTIALLDVAGARTVVLIKPSDLVVLRAYGDQGFTKGGES